MRRFKKKNWNPHPKQVTRDKPLGFFKRLTVNLNFLCWPVKICYCLNGKFWAIHCTHQSSYHRITICFCLYDPFFNQKADTLRQCRRHLNQQNEPLISVTKFDPHPQLTMCCLYDGIRKGSSTRGFFCKSKRLIQINTAPK